MSATERNFYFWFIVVSHLLVGGGCYFAFMERQDYDYAIYFGSVFLLSGALLARNLRGDWRR